MGLHRSAKELSQKEAELGHLLVEVTRLVHTTEVEAHCNLLGALIWTYSHVKWICFSVRVCVSVLFLRRK